jgi:hypothetical protein
MRERVTDSFVRLLCCKWGVAPAAREMLQGLCEVSTAARHVTETQGEEHVARNHNNDQRITFRDDRIAINPATTSPSQDPEKHPGWFWDMHLAGYFTPDTIQPVAKGAAPCRWRPLMSNVTRMLGGARTPGRFACARSVLAIGFRVRPRR